MRGGPRGVCTPLAVSRTDTAGGRRALSSEKPYNERGGDLLCSLFLAACLILLADLSRHTTCMNSRSLPLAEGQKKKHHIRKKPFFSLSLPLLLLLELVFVAVAELATW